MKDLKKMTKKERKAILISVCTEVQDLCEFEPAIKTDGCAEKDLIASLTEAYPELTADDKLSEEAISTFKFLGLRKLDVVEEEENEEEAEEEANEDAEEVDKEEVAKKEAKPKKVSAKKDSKKPEKKPAAKKASSSKSKEKPQKNTMNRQEAVLTTIKTKCKKHLSITEIAELSNELYIEKNSNAHGVSDIKNMMNVVRHSVIALYKFDVLKCEGGKYFL